MGPEDMLECRHNQKMVRKATLQPVCTMSSLPISYTKSYQSSYCTQGNIGIRAIGLTRRMSIQFVRRRVMILAHRSYSLILSIIRMYEKVIMHRKNGVQETGGI
jgi:hypothetical protein